MPALLLLLSGTQFADDKTDWVPTSTNPEIQYRTQVYENTEACYLEFRDQEQGPRSTTFDAEVDFKTRDREHNGEQVIKTDRENIVTTPTHPGSSRISNCLGITGVRLSFVQRN